MTPITCVYVCNYIPENNQKASNQNINSGYFSVFGVYFLPYTFVYSNFFYKQIYIQPKDGYSF